MDQQGLASDVMVQCGRRYRQVLDKTVTYAAVRWVVLFSLLVLFCLRIWLLQGWFIVTYGLGIFLLNLFIGFITPLVRTRACAVRRTRELLRRLLIFAGPAPPLLSPLRADESRNGWSRITTKIE
jgi:hypothetical protein